jgi:Holliday junction resolvase RusA-like endonuclease
MNIDVFISGEPYSQNKARGNVEGLKKWSEAILEATKDLPRTTSECKAEITFVLPPNKYPTDHPYGSDLDNLLKRLFDALNKTIFADVAGKDGSVVGLMATKRMSTDADPPGAYLKIREIQHILIDRPTT